MTVAADDERPIGFQDDEEMWESIDREMAGSRLFTTECESGAKKCGVRTQNR